MPVSTRSLITSNGQNETNPEQRIRTRADQEDDTVPSLSLRNPHHGLKEKLRALTVLYEQQKQASASLRKEDTKPKPHNVMRENMMFNSTITRTYVLPQPPLDDAKENLVSGTDRIVGFSTTVARKLPMELRENRGAKNVAESEKRQVVSEKPSRIGSRILVFVRLRPMAKKEKEAGSRCCVGIVKRRDVYLTEFANENDYLRLNRVRGRHFTFDASFPESATQEEVYSTT